jgi:tetrahydromethanopterin S-methyltransferase subunit G
MELLSEADKEHSKHQEIDLALDKIREKYGNSSITFGKLIGNDIGIRTGKDYDNEE